VPQPRCGAAPAQSASPQHAAHESPQQWVPVAHASCVHVPAIVHVSVVQPSPSLHCEALQHAAQRPPPQSNCPLGHTHEPATQICPIAHACAHAPQFAASDVRSVSQPFDGMWSQSPWPIAHPHAPGAMPLHNWPGPHACPHAPQLSRSCSPSTQDIPHRICPDAQVDTQPVGLQNGVAPMQWTPHAPQFIGSVATTAQSAAVEGHRSWPGRHEHVPAMQPSLG
jgi:hypothetical protein